MVAGVLVLWCESLEEKEFFIEGDPEKFFTTPLAELLAESFRIRGGTP